jgi:hypothetical protein
LVVTIAPAAYDPLELVVVAADAVCSGVLVAGALAELLVLLLLPPHPASRARTTGAATAMLALLIGPPKGFGAV